jgi:hypothetical protein
MKNNSYRLAWIASLLAGIFSGVGAARSILKSDFTGGVISGAAALLFLIGALGFYVYSKS